MAYAFIAPLWRFPGAAVAQWDVVAYRTMLARPIDMGWFRR